MRRLTPFFIAACAACASSPSSDPRNVPAPSDRTIAVDDQNIYRTTVPPSAKAPIAGTPERAFEALRSVYAELGIPPAIMDAKTFRIGNTNFWLARRLGGQSLSTYLNCGDTFSGPVADTYRIYMSLVSTLRADGSGGSELETALYASAQNMEGASTARIPCGTSGRLEERIRKTVLLKIGAGQ